MTREEKNLTIEELKKKFTDYEYFYVADSSELTVADVNKLRGLLHEKGIKMRVVKNTLAKKALETFDADKGYEPIYETLVGPTAFMFSDVANAPARVIKEFRKSSEKPILKAAYIDSDVFIGDDQVDALATLKSKEELIGDVITLLQSPVKTLLGGLQSGGNTLSGLLKALEERGEA